MSKETNSKDLLDAELFISSSLRLGVYLSAAVIVIGMILFFATSSSGYQTDQFPTTVGGVLSETMHFNPSAIISLGLLLLIVTPVFRVAASVLLFVLEKDHLYTVITLFVLCVLIISFMLGKAL
ncbi:DUF1634 domain-containing protein [Desulfosporosinus metallidurans]|uniref:DUF1634 domain-containing protein n=1 Tax=Desulfosporosinus metallidurans TaxID=1888891 RepID=A0A1Q8QMP3_9FIRM|nr:DUF1634 domain-containing protein [Desulfosporosinus metallidurans]OLN28610.1 hypothetical protein DSOL_3988 [Desulfosporosinus metallidurans]